MTIIGIGVDVVHIERFRQSLERTPALATKLFTATELLRNETSLAARFAAKEAIAKALGAPPGLGWHDAEIVTEASGAPRFELRGTVWEHASAIGVVSVHVSLTHDAGVATAFVVLEG